MVLSEANKTYPTMFHSCKAIARKDALYAFKTKASFKEKISAVIFTICPRMIFIKIYLKRALIKMNKWYKI